MDNKEREFYLHKHYGIEPFKKVVKSVKPKTNDVYELIYIPNKQRVMFGFYSLCKNHLINKFMVHERKNYKIVLLNKSK